MLRNGLIKAGKDYGSLLRVHCGKHISLQVEACSEGTHLVGNLACKVLVRSKAPEPKLLHVSPIAGAARRTTRPRMHRGQLPIGGSGRGGDAPTGRPAYAPSLGEDVPSSGGAMRPDQASLWYRRMSSVYALGTWTLLGSLILSGRKKSKPLGDEVEQKDVSTYESPESGDELDLMKEITEPPKGFYVETIVTYKEDFVPMTDKILNYWKSWTGGPGPES